MDKEQFLRFNLSFLRILTMSSYLHIIHIQAYQSQSSADYDILSDLFSRNAGSAKRSFSDALQVTRSRMQPASSLIVNLFKNIVDNTRVPMLSFFRREAKSVQKIVPSGFS